MERITIDRQEQSAPPQQQQRGGLSTLTNVVGILMGVAFIVAVGIIVALNMGWITPMQPVAVPAQEAPTARPVATAVIRVVPIPQHADPPAQVQADQGGSVPASQPVQPVIVEQPAPVEYIPPAEPAVQPTPDLWYQGTIKDYADRDPCSMPRANPQTCGGEVPPLPWPEGRAP